MEGSAMLRILLVLLLVLAAFWVASASYGRRRWRQQTRDLRARLAAAAHPVQPSVVDFRELEALPAPVQRYFRTVLTDAQPLIAAARVRHRGHFNMSETGAGWRPFRSDQLVITQRPGFDWNARVAALPGVPARAHDAYVAGEGLLEVSLLGLVPVARLRGGGELAAGELVRFFAEAACYPTALLPSQGVRWEARDDRSALATLEDGGLSVQLLFRFDARGMIERVCAESRARLLDGRKVPTPWEGRFGDYARRDGMWVPLVGEAAWRLPDGPHPYWRGRITRIDYRFADSAVPRAFLEQQRHSR
ncbi:MAG: hypothetical protein GF330_03120 [Candidatus Eisenbacteria bacterium]|nr:hypothetical protein [Candidatus Eisenbacteria bacterium]